MTTSNVYPPLRERIIAALVHATTPKRPPVEHIGGSWSPAQHARGGK